MRRLLGAVGFCLLLALTPATAQAATSTIETGTGNSFSVSDYTIDRGDLVVFSNTGSQPHNVKSLEMFGAGFLFGSSTIQPGATAPIEGVEYLNTGTYGFFCTLHPGMEANLVVTSGGTPVSRPSIDSRILFDRKRTLVRRGTVRIELTSATSVDSANVRVIRGGRPVGTASTSLSAATPRVIAVRLSRGLRRQIAKLRAVRLSVEGAVPYGTVSGATRSFR